MTWKESSKFAFIFALCFVVAITVFIGVMSLLDYLSDLLPWYLSASLWFLIACTAFGTIVFKFFFEDSDIDFMRDSLVTVKRKLKR